MLGSTREQTASDCVAQASKLVDEVRRKVCAVCAARTRNVQVPKSLLFLGSRTVHWLGKRRRPSHRPLGGGWGAGPAQRSPVTELIQKAGGVGGPNRGNGAARSALVRGRSAVAVAVVTGKRSNTCISLSGHNTSLCIEMLPPGSSARGTRVLRIPSRRPLTRATPTPFV